MVIYDGIIYSLQRRGGITTLFDQLITRMPENSYKLLVYDGYTKINCLSSCVRMKTRFFERYRKANVRNQSKVFHSTYYRLPASEKVPVVTTVHDFSYEKYRKGLAKYVHAEQKYKAISKSDRIICVSESTKNDLLYYTNVKDDNVSVIHNGVSEIYAPIKGVEVSNQVLFVGGRAGYKNFEPVIRAVGAFEDLFLVCVGGGEFTIKERILLDKIIPKRYMHLGYLSETNLNIEYNKSICLVYSSLYEGFGIPVVEAMKAGCPVIAVDSSSIPEISGGSALLIETGESDEIMAAVNKMLDSDFRKIMVERGKNNAVKFSWNRTYKETVKVYESLLGACI